MHWDEGIMEKLHGKYLAAVVVLSLVVTFTSAALVSTIDCTTRTACDDIEHSTCDTVTNFCKCDAAYKDGTGDAEGTCVAKGLTDDCSAASDCIGVDNAVCTSNECVCKQYYTPTTGQCAGPGLTEACGADADCSGVANAVCISNACDCKQYYTPTSGQCAGPGLGDTCGQTSDCSEVPNAECVGSPLECTCKTGYTESGGQCSAAAGLQPLLSVHVALLLLILTLAIKSRY